MESKLKKQSERARLLATQSLTPARRLDAFLQHCRFMTELYRAARRSRSPARSQS